MIRMLILVIRLGSYLALTAVMAGFAAVTLVTSTGVCPRFDEGAVQCVSPFYAQVGGIGLFVLLGSVFTGLPAIFAIAGVVFLFRDIRSFVRRRRS